MKCFRWKSSNNDITRAFNDVLLELLVSQVSHCFFNYKYEKDGITNRNKWNFSDIFLRKKISLMKNVISGVYFLLRNHSSPPPAPISFDNLPPTLLVLLFLGVLVHGGGRTGGSASPPPPSLIKKWKFDL